MNQMKKKSIFQLAFFVMCFASFVACGEGFSVKTQNLPRVTAAGADVPFKPTIQVQKGFAGEYGGYQLTFIINDPQRGRTVAVSTAHNDLHSVAAYTNDGEFSYHVTAICFSPDFSCNDVGALVYRSSANEVYQTALRAVGNGMTLSVVRQDNGTAYDSVEGVYYALPY